MWDMNDVEGLLHNYKRSLQNRPPWKNASLNTFAQSSRQSFLVQGFPDKTKESWKFTNPQKKMLKEIHSPKKTSHQTKLNPFILHPQNVIAIVNGSYSKELSQTLPGVSIHIYSTKSRDLPPSCLELLEGQHQDPFDSLNGGLTKEILFLNIDESYHSDIPLTILHLNTADEVTLCPRLIVNALRSSTGHLVEHFASSTQKEYQTYAITNIRLQESAKLNYTKIQNQNTLSFHYGKVEISLDQKASLSSLILSLGAALSRNNIHVYLNGIHAHSQVDGLFFPCHNGHCDNYSEIHHNIPYTYSDQLFKGILQEDCQGIFTGKIFIHKDAQKVESSQLSRNLLLSRKAQIITRPQLEIYADDVQCNHGATTGEINPEEIFYLKTRGIPEEMAKEMLIEAFMLDVVEKQNSPPLKKFLQPILDKIQLKEGSNE